MTMPSRSFLSSYKLFTPWYFNEIPNIVLTTAHKGVEAFLINPNSMCKIFDALSYYSCKIFTVENFWRV